MRPRDRAAGDRTGPSGISEALFESYTRAVYRVDFHPSPIFLEVGEPSPELERWLAASGAVGLAFLSAANPGAVALSDDDNRRRHQRLVEHLLERGLATISGESYEPVSGAWREASLLVCGIERAAAIALAREFGQVALLYFESGGPVELVPTAGPR